MKWWQHAIFSGVGVCVVLLLIAVLDRPEFGPFDVVAFFSYSIPDLDLKSKGKIVHRHWFWHSAIIPGFVFLVGLLKLNFAGVASFCVAVGFHLFGDVKSDTKGKRGTYLIFIRDGDRMSVVNTDRYLLLNGLACIIMAAISMAF